MTAPQSKLLGLLPIKGREEIRRVYSADGLSPAIVTNGGGNHEPKIAVPQTICLNPKVNGRQPSLNDRVYSTEGVSPAVTTTEFFMGNIAVRKTAERKENDNMLRIRKLTEGECYRLMGFEKKDTQACKSAGQSKSNIYHQAGDSLVTTVMIGLFGSLFEIDYNKCIDEYVDELHREVL